MELATQTFLGAAKLVKESGQHPGMLKDEVHPTDHHKLMIIQLFHRKLNYCQGVRRWRHDDRRRSRTGEGGRSIGHD